LLTMGNAQTKKGKTAHQPQRRVMGNAHPKNKTGKKVVEQKLEHAQKTGVLSLREHRLDELPAAVYSITTLTTLDLSKNNLKAIGSQLAALAKLKTLNLQENQIRAGGIVAVSKLTKLQKLDCGGNRLGKPLAAEPGKPAARPDPLPASLPATLKQLSLDRNSLIQVPRPVVSASLKKLEKLDLSHNQLAAIPQEIRNLVSLTELILDSNMITSLPSSIGALSKLKTLSLKGNHISVRSTHFSASNPQPLPATLFSATPLIDLNLHGNPMTSTQLNEFDGYPKFLERREKVKTKDLYGGAMTSLDVCGLK